MLYPLVCSFCPQTPDFKIFFVCMWYLILLSQKPPIRSSFTKNSAELFPREEAPTQISQVRGTTATEY